MCVNAKGGELLLINRNTHTTHEAVKKITHEEDVMSKPAQSPLKLEPMEVQHAVMRLSELRCQANNFSLTGDELLGAGFGHSNDRNNLEAYASWLYAQLLQYPQLFTSSHNQAPVMEPVMN
jgi:hypothetical protein